MNVNLSIDPFFSLSSELMCVIETSGNIRQVNPSFARLLGYHPLQLQNKNILDLIHQDDSEISHKYLRAYLSASETIPIFTIRYQAQDSSYKWVSWYNAMIKDGCIFFIGKDVTQIKEKGFFLTQLESALKSIGTLDTVFNAIPEFICLLNSQLEFIYINRFAATQLNIHQSTMIGQSVDQLEHRYTGLDKVKENVKNVFHNGTPYYNSFTIEHEGTTMVMEYSVLPILSEDVISAVIFTTKDVTQTVNDRKNVDASDKKLKNIIDLVPYPIFLKDKDCRYTLINKAQAKLFETSIDKIIGKSDEDFVHDPVQLQEIVSSDQRVLKEQHPVVLTEQVLSDKEGNKKILHTTKIPFENEIEGSMNILGISIDITSVKNAEEELLRTNFELDSFVYKSSHDLRAPLRSIIGLLNLARKEQDPEMRNHILERSNKSIGKLDTFILELTNFSRNSRLQVVSSKIHFENIIRECLENLKFMDNAGKVKVTLDIKDSVAFHSDESRISILLMNLISNAIKYQNPEHESPFVKVQVNTDEKGALITITDNGIGIEKEFHHKVFDMFFRASENSFGSGLGLYIVRQVVDKLNGTITIDSLPGRGTTFIIVLPTMVEEL